MLQHAARNMLHMYVACRTHSFTLQHAARNMLHMYVARRTHSFTLQHACGRGLRAEGCLKGALRLDVRHRPLLFQLRQRNLRCDPFVLEAGQQHLAAGDMQRIIYNTQRTPSSPSSLDPAHSVRRTQACIARGLSPYGLGGKARMAPGVAAIRSGQY